MGPVGDDQPHSILICLLFVLVVQFPLPFLTSISLHINNGVTLIYNFSSDNGFDDVFHGNNSQETAVFILYLCDVFLFQKHFFPDFAH